MIYLYIFKTIFIKIYDIFKIIFIKDHFYKYLCDAPKPGGPLTTRQPAENLYISDHETHT